MNRFISNRWL